MYKRQARFEAFLKDNEKAPGANLLKEGYNYMLMEHAADPDTLVHEWAESVIGDQYPVPDRILYFTEQIVQDYLAQEMCDRRPPKGTFDLFATEGGTAAMCYLFDSLEENFLLNQGDSIALMIPVFTPYIEIPQLRRYQFNVTEISADQMTADGLHTWQYKDEDIDKLKNPQIKALFITNPSNPPSYALSPETAARIVNIVKNDNPNLMIITDDVYGTFIPHFRSLMAELPHNTLCVYSFSKYFGATGWRNAVIALHEDLSLIHIFKEYAKQVQKNAAVLAQALIDRGFTIVSGGTDNHSMLVDLRSKYPDLTGKVAEKALVSADITVNKNMVPFDSRSAFQTSGIRLGTPAITTRGAKEDLMLEIAEMIETVLSNVDNEEVIAQVRARVNETMKKYPLFAY